MAEGWTTGAGYLPSAFRANQIGAAETLNYICSIPERLAQLGRLRPRVHVSRDPGPVVLLDNPASDVRWCGSRERTRTVDGFKESGAFVDLADPDYRRERTQNS